MLLVSSTIRLAAVAFVVVGVLSTSVAAGQQSPNAARYDNYRLYRLHLATDEQVTVFQELERLSDSVIFYGHARSVGQDLTVLVAAHKVADFAELVQRYKVENRILVSTNNRE